MQPVSRINRGPTGDAQLGTMTDSFLKLAVLRHNMNNYLIANIFLVSGLSGLIEEWTQWLGSSLILVGGRRDHDSAVGVVPLHPSPCSADYSRQYLSAPSAGGALVSAMPERPVFSSVL